MLLENSKVLVIGGSSGIGLGTAMVCANKKAQVIIASRCEEKLKASFDRIENCAGYEIVDILSSHSVTSLFSRVGKIDHLIVTSGAVTGKKFNELSEEEARRDFDLNVWGKFKAAKSAEAYLDKKGSIIFISGAFAQRLNPNVFATSLAVCAVEAMAKLLALSLAPIRVNVISPYVIDASPVSSTPLTEARKEFLATTSSQLPTGCVGTPFDVGEAAAMIMSNPYITGSVVSVDGGFTI